ncbi:MAG: hypothetical protein ABT940_08410 [Alphaproteobacteria bacterium]
MDQIATRSDLLLLKIDLQRFERRMIFKLGGPVVAATGLLFAAIRYSPGH